MAPSALDALARHFVAMPVHRRCGVYVLLRGDEVVYVGQSGDVDARLNTHRGHARKTPRFNFDGARVLELPEAEALLCERALIYALLPKYNTIVVPIGEIERAALSTLGVAVLDEDRSLRYIEEFRLTCAERNARELSDRRSHRGAL